ncbi:MAG: single-stranded-DNA-specific exonuclease RecJ [Deltaproteobacteria bacterium]|nr:single-stranded-DNA-specific exonuclease RecJ [Deltaproteobacteria bacterium]MBT7204586.1 single-stranded-DNA-specific exonuclease RecJ [Deltaproteobacteria bacterium]
MTKLPSFRDLSWQDLESSSSTFLVNRIRKELGLSKVVAELLTIRQLEKLEEIEAFLYPRFEHCSDPFLMADMEIAVERILKALSQGESLVVYGDYDVDGTAGAVILYRYLKRIGLRAHYFIPERLKDGYGLTETTLVELKSRKTDLILTVDNGATAVEEALIIRELGMELLITDHHLLGEEIPNATAMINPHQPNCKYPFKGLCGTGVAYKLLQALDQTLTEKGYWQGTSYIRPNLMRDLDLVCLATIADRVPLTGENRFFVQAGLEVLNDHPRPGLQALMRASHQRGRVTPTTISFKIAPKINAVGRLSDPRIGARLLLSHSLNEARPYADKLLQLNSERQTIEREIFHSALRQASEQKHLNAIILFDENWHPGVMGNIATKISRQFQKTTLALTRNQGELLGGSARSLDGFDVRSVLENCSDVLERFGGHQAAAGLSLMAKNMEAFCEQFQYLMGGKELENQTGENFLEIETWINEEDLSPQLASDLVRLAPFGTNNPEPVIGIRQAKPHSISLFGNNHLKFNLINDDQQYEVVAWDSSDWYPHLGGHFDMVVSPQIISRFNQNALQFRVLDLRPVP